MSVALKARPALSGINIDPWFEAQPLQRTANPLV